MESSVTQSMGGESSCDSMDKNLLTSWNFDEKICKYYVSQGVTSFFDWQVEAISLPGVMEGGNLVYSAPTSAGKTLLADVLLFKRLLESRKKGIVILPFDLNVGKKVNSLKLLSQSLGFRIVPFAGSVNSSSDLKLESVDIAVCTIEQASNMVNRLIEENKLDKVSIIVIDELHMLGDKNRGHLLELLLTKFRFLAKIRSADLPQIVGMSSTRSNLSVVADWLDAEHYATDYRPVPLVERVVIDDSICDFRFHSEKQETASLLGSSTSKFKSLVGPRQAIDASEFGIAPEKDANIIYLTIETIMGGHNCLIFCSAQEHCERLAKRIVKSIVEINDNLKNKGEPSKSKACSQKLQETLNVGQIEELISSLKQCSTSLDSSLELAIRNGIAFHHPDLSIQERVLIENAFAKGTLRVLCSTTALLADVNLPAYRVMISSALDYQQSPLDATSYRQMIGLAGRQGVDTLSEAMLFTNQHDLPKAVQMIRSSMQPVRSSLANYHVKTIISPMKRATPDDESELWISQTKTLTSDSFNRAALEAIVYGLASSSAELEHYFKNTFLYYSGQLDEIELSKSIQLTIDCLRDHQLIYDELEHQDFEQATQFTPSGHFVVWPFGRAVIDSGLSIDQGIFHMNELNLARQNICLKNELHLIYLVTPVYLPNQLPEGISWAHYHKRFLRMDNDMRNVANMLGIEESYIKGGQNNPTVEKLYKRYIRFFFSLVVFDLTQGVSPASVAEGYNLSNGIVQTLKLQTLQLADKMKTFCDRLKWYHLHILLTQIEKSLKQKLVSSNRKPLSLTYMLPTQN